VLRASHWRPDALGSPHETASARARLHQ
jgi:hypothetical protein